MDLIEKLDVVTEANLSPEQALNLVSLLNSTSPHAESVKARLYPDLITRIAGLMFGDAPGWSSHLTPLHQPIRCWLDIADFSRYSEFDEYNKQVYKVSKNEISEPQKSQVLQWIKRFSDLDRVRLANTLIAMLKPFDPQEEDKDRLRHSLLFFDDIHDKMSTSLFARFAILPLSTQRLLTSSGFIMPTDSLLRLPGGLLTDMVLNVLADRFKDKQRRQLQSGKEPVSFLPQLGSAMSTSATTTTTTTTLENSGRRGLFVDSRALFLILFFNYQVSSTRWKEDLRRKLLEEKSKLVPEFGFIDYPLLYQDLDHVFEFRPYQTILFELLGVHLPTHILWDPPDHKPPHPESKLFLALFISSWLLQNPPYQTKISPSHIVQHMGGPTLIRQSVARHSVSQSPSSRPYSRLFDDPGVFGPDSIAPSSTPEKNFFSTIDKATPATSQSQNISAPDPYTPSPNTYLPPSLDLLISVSVTITLQLCDKEFPDEIVCSEMKEIPKLRSGGKTILELAGLAAGGISKRIIEEDQFLNQDIARQLLKNSRIKGQYSRPFPGTVAVPAIWEQIHSPLFHFFRNHLHQLDVLSDPVLFSTLVDTWCMVLTPWRARPRWKIKSRSKLEPDIPCRYFSYNEEVSRQLKEFANEKRRQNTTAGTNRSSLERLETISLLDEDFQTAKKNVRSSPLYIAKLKSTRDFEGGVYEAMFRETLSESEKLAQKAYTLNDWRPWIRLHFLFYVHLLPIFLRQVSLADFSSSPPILLATLERVLDIFEPQLVDELRQCEEDWRKIFSSNINVTQDSDREITARRIQLLAHRNMLQLPPEVNPIELVDVNLKSNTTKRNLVDISESVSVVLDKLNVALKSRKIERPPPVSIPEACRILIKTPRDNIGEFPLYEHHSFWHGFEVVCEDIVRIFIHLFFRFFIALKVSQIDGIHRNDIRDQNCSCKTCLLAKRIAKVVVTPAEGLSNIFFLSVSRLHDFKKMINETASTSQHSIDTFLKVFFVSKNVVKDEVVKQETISIPSSSIPPGLYLLERLNLCVDRLQILKSQSYEEAMLKLNEEMIVACELRDYRRKPLLLQLLEFWQTPLGFFFSKGKRVLNEFIQDESSLPGWWESSVFLSLTVFLSGILTRFGFSRVSGRNFCRILADVRVLLALLTWFVFVWLIWQYLGSYLTAFFVLSSFILRHLLVRDLINSIKQLIAFVIALAVMLLWFLNKVETTSTLVLLLILFIVTVSS
jgi:hypothetical protein